MSQKAFKNVAVGTEFRRRNFAAHDWVPGILWFVKISDQTAKITSDDYKDKELDLDPDEVVFTWEGK